MSGEVDPALIEPRRKVRDQPSRYLHRGRCISLVPQLRNKNLNERRKRTLLHLPVRVSEFLSHDHLQSHHKAWLVMKLCRAKFANWSLMQGDDRYVSEYFWTRDSGAYSDSGIGVTALRPTCWNRRWTFA